MTTTSSATLLTDSNGASSSSSGDIGSISTNDALIIQTDPNGIITLAEHNNEIISTVPSSPNDTKSTSLDVTSNTENGSNNKIRHQSKQPLSSSTSSSRDDVKEIDPRDRRLIYVSSLQLILGGLIFVWACAVISHDASLGGASAAASLIGGVAALTAGIAGFTSRRSKKRNKSAHTSATSTVALSAVALAACSLVMALSATGLLRDGSRPTQQVTWGALLSNTGLLLTSGMLSATCIVAGALWRRDAGICTSRRHTTTRPPASPEPLPGTPPAPHKHKLVSKWLGQQQGGGPALFMISPMPPPSGRGGSVYSGHSAPHIIPLHMPPPPPPLALPPYLLPPMGPPPPCMLHGAAMTLPANHKHRRRSRHQRRNSCVSEGRGAPQPALMTVERDPEEEARLAALASKRQRQPNALTEEEVERSYTGLDRAIAEDFITNTMEKHREPRRISTASRGSMPLSVHEPMHDDSSRL